MKALFSVLAVFGAVIMVSMLGLVITGNYVRTKVYWPSYDIPFSEEKILAGENVQKLIQELGYDQEHAVEVLKLELSKNGATCYNSDGNPLKEHLKKGFAVDRSGDLEVDTCGYVKTDNRYVLREAYCGENSYVAVRTRYCENCQNGACAE